MPFCQNGMVLIGIIKFYITLLYMNSLINDGRSHVLQITSVYVRICINFVQMYSYYCTPLYVSNSHINVRLEASHKQKLYKVTGYKYILHFVQVG